MNWELFRITRILLKSFVALPYAFLLWMGQPYRYNTVVSIQEHYIGRFFCFICALVCSFLFLLLFLFAFKIFFSIGVSFVLTSVIFDLVIMGCRAMLVHEAIKRKPEGVNALTVWEDKSLWEDDDYYYANKNRW